MKDLRLAQSDLLAVKADRNAGAELLHSAAYAGLQAPLSGVAQLTDRIAGTNLLPSVNFMDAPKEQEFLSTKWHAQQVGSMLGMTVPFLLLHKGVGKCGEFAFGKIENTMVNQTALMRRVVGESMVSGALFEGLLHPTDAAHCIQNEDLLVSRIKQSITGATTFGVLAGCATKLQSLAGFERSLSASVLRSEIGTTMAAGIPAGAINAELTSRLNRGSGATWSEAVQGMYTFSIIGGAIAGGKHVYGRTSSEGALRTSFRNPERRTPGAETSLATQVHFSLGEVGRLGSTEQIIVAAAHEAPVVHDAASAQPAAPKLTDRQGRPAYDHPCLRQLQIPENHPNPLLARYEAACASATTRAGYYHSYLIAHYAHSVPTEPVLAFIKALGPVVEVGAGTGYWSALLRARGAEVHAYDNWSSSSYAARNTWTEVATGDAAMTGKHPDHTLLLSWPSAGAGSKALENFKGNRMIYVGEITHSNYRNSAPRLPERETWHCDIMGDTQFFEMLQRDWNLVARLDTPQLTPSVNDAMYYFARRSRVEKLVERNRARVAEREERAERARRAR
ncbi:MAG: class I SAM-dependent methyltransferase [Candidatus Obscuribacterales bacterium]|nr:class I SAM-dependent methyltransferase [Candidatus Obscuribacterales bacterium]